MLQHAAGFVTCAPVSEQSAYVRSAECNDSGEWKGKVVGNPKESRVTGDVGRYYLSVFFILFDLI